MLIDSEFDLMTGPQLPAHVYVHVPFCVSKCSYCDFASVAGAGDMLVSAVIDGIRAELRGWGASALPGVVDTLYIGGGTPTHVLSHSLRVLEQAHRRLPLRPDAEITVEANPESFSAQAARSLAAAGVTRLSLGVQSFDDAMLRLLGRAHDADMAVSAAVAAVDAGLSLSVDLMCGIPGQTMTSWQETLDRAVRTGAEHVSVYPLSLEAGTALAVACDAGLVEEPDPDVAADMMVLAEEVLSVAGIVRYETANYARPGLESQHNMAYWTGRPYLGIGPAAHGMLDAATAGAVGLMFTVGSLQESDIAQNGIASAAGPYPVARVRYWQPADVQSWLFGGQQGMETLTAREARREDVMLGMRLRTGVRAARVHEAGLDEVFAGLEADGLVTQGAEVVPATGVGAGAESVESDGRRGSSWRTTRRGWLLGNEVFRRIWTVE